MLSYLLPIVTSLGAVQPFTSLMDLDTTLANTSSISEQVSYLFNREKSTYVRCWYRTSHAIEEVGTDWEWALNENGDYLKLDGYWWSAVQHKNMFYTDTPQSYIQERCEQTLGVTHDNADITFYAADNQLSYNHTIWSNDYVMQANALNKVVVLGDSLSDTGNIFNASQWQFPNPHSWFMGHFSNGFIWAEYLAKAKNLPVYNWSVGGAAGSNQYLLLTGVNEQVTSFLTYMEEAKNYRIENTLFTLEFGLNDFMNYGREVTDVKADFSRAMVRLTDAGAKHLVLLTLPDATKAPQFKYSTEDEIAVIRKKVIEFNAFIEDQAAAYKSKGINITLLDGYSLFEDLTSNPEKHGFVNTTEPCLNLNRSAAQDYLYSHDITNQCAEIGSDNYVFWDVTHPTTAVHKYLAGKVLEAEKTAL
ncbi:SGNH/GDSL hydrolase family protein [Vibrio nigripulchritudo]|uniref:SGNH/GDSL hydrolase family protein n=1 Tax=Vibrio nigripulchritudo TaxID=28173 RepID=UPI0003B19701|nr:SGNH/GDSL hydrolase family protein [Vibrio nigripulchritudo]CCN72574.1 Thermolabile hemolysin [Vibrio nigripulchritudo SFn118]